MKKENWMLSWMSKKKKSAFLCREGFDLVETGRKELEPGLIVRSIIRLTEGKWVADNNS